MLLLAGGGESTGDGDEDDLLVQELCVVGEIALVTREKEPDEVSCSSNPWHVCLPLLASYWMGRPQTVRSVSPLGAT